VNGEEVTMFKIVKLKYFEIAVDTETNTLMIACFPDGVEFGPEYSKHYFDEIEVIYLARRLKENFALMRTIQGTSVKLSWRPVTTESYRLTIREKIWDVADYIFTTREIAMLVPVEKVEEIYEVLEALK